MHRFQGESREAYSDVFGAACGGRGILDPFTLVGDDCLAGDDIQFAAFVLYPQSAFQDDGEFVELRGLSRLLPALRTAHVGNAHARGPGIDAADEFVNQFRFGAGGADARRLSDQSGHGFSFGNGDFQFIKNLVWGGRPRPPLLILKLSIRNLPLSVAG